jgi:NADPH:quinone reductase-like Zn-dependent oxidoreductase
MESIILIAEQYGDPSVLRYVRQSLGPLAPGMARIQVKAAGINPIDARRMTGEFKHGGLPQAFGTEFAGEIVQVNGASWKAGDAVLGSGGGFTHASIIDVPVGNLVAKPAALDWAVAGSVAGVAQTAMTVLDELGPVKTLLVHGASGGVGSILVQLAKARGIAVVGTASSKNLDYLYSLGASAVAYGEGVLDRILALHPETFDAAVDLAGSAEATAVSLAVVKPGGVIGSLTGKPITHPRVKAMWVKRNVQNLQDVVEGLASGKFTWEIHQTFPFADAPQAYSEVLKGHSRGKNVLVF